jgi:hypothetical protein
MQSRGQQQLTRLQLNVHVLISVGRDCTRAYVSGLDIEYKKKRKEKLRIGLYFRHKKEERINFFFNTVE